MLTLLLSLPPHLFQSCSVYSFSLPPGLSPIAPPQLSPFDTVSIYLCTPPLPPPRPFAERPSTWTTPLTTGFHRPSALTSHSGRPNVVPRASMCRPYPRPVAPPCRPQIFPMYLSDPEFSFPGVRSSICLSINLTPPDGCISTHPTNILPHVSIWLCVGVGVAGHQPVRYVQIMRWCSSNLGQ